MRIAGDGTMTLLRLRYPVHALDDTLLLPAGTFLTRQVLDDLAEAGRKRSWEKVPLLSQGILCEDLAGLMSREPYRTIFDDPVREKYRRDLMEKVCLIPPAVVFLNYFKRRDLPTYKQALMVFALSSFLGRDLLSDGCDSEGWGLAGLLHNFGKLTVPLRILKKKQPLTREEREILNHHASAGFVLLTYYYQDPECLPARAARDCRERRDGTGYPQGARLADRRVEIIAACDIYNALISSRPYRPASFENRAALDELTGMAGRGAIDPDIVRALIAVNRRNKTHYSECRLSLTRRSAPPQESVYGTTV